MLFLKILIAFLIATDMLDYLNSKKDKINDGKTSLLFGVIIGICLRSYGVYLIFN